MINFTLNNELVEIDVCPSKRLIDVLREDFSLTGSKEGCGEGECGACAVLIDGRLANSCLVAVGSVSNHSVTTIEGFSESEQFEVLAAAFAKVGAVQCGFCIPGMVLAAESVLAQNASPSEDELRDGISGNLCRCTGYETIVEAIKEASNTGAGTLWPRTEKGEESDFE